MRVLIAGLMAAAATISAVPASAVTHKVSCLCDCPDDVKARPQHHAMAAPAPRPRAVHRVARTRSSYGYNYASAAPIRGGEWHGAWRVAPNDLIQAFDSPPPSYPAPAYGAPAGYYGPPPSYYEQSAIRVDDRGWTGGVGANADGGGGGGGGFMDGFGQVHFAQGGGQENGPTYNSYNQSFQYNPSVPGPFQNRLMGGQAPTK